MENYILKNRDALSVSNYIRKADPKQDYWFDFSVDRLRKYIRQFGDAFNLIIAGSELVEGDFFVIPFSSVRHMLRDSYLSEGKRRRWIGSIRYNELRIRNCPESLDIGNLYGSPEVINNPVISLEIPEVEQADYAIENRLREIKARQKQSLFRSRVLANFDYKCCLSDIGENDLLVASHIIPWSERIDTRLDPANGLCLFVLYDKLFDEGYISFDDTLQVVITSQFSRLTQELQVVLRSIEGKKIRTPKNHSINNEFLRYHRENKFRT